MQAGLVDDWTASIRWHHTFVWIAKCSGIARAWEYNLQLQEKPMSVIFFGTNAILILWIFADPNPKLKTKAECNCVERYLIISQSASFKTSCTIIKIIFPCPYELLIESKLYNFAAPHTKNAPNINFNCPKNHFHL